MIQFNKMRLPSSLLHPPPFGVALKTGLVSLALLGGLGVFGALMQKQGNLSDYSNRLYARGENLESELASVSAVLSALQHEDQYVRNEELEDTIGKIEDAYSDAVDVYERMLDLRGDGGKMADIESGFAEVLDLLSQRNYATAASELNKVTQLIAAERTRLASEFTIPENVQSSNTPPGSGYSRQRVETDIGAYLVSMVAADLNNTRVVVDTASENDCGNDCPVLPLATYVARSGAFAGINGPYFCPADYPSCADKKNSFDMLVMNKNKHYFNSDNNVYSTVPAVIFSGNSARFVGKTQEWGRDTGVDAVVANHPLLVSGGNVAFHGDGDPKKGSKGPRGFIGTKGSTVYIGVVHSATVAEAARALHALGLENALNLDGGGSSALWSGGYKVGPGRNLPFGILLVRK